MTNQPLPLIRLAFLIDDEVSEVVNTDERLAAMWLSEPKVLDITDRYDVITAQGDIKGMKYNPDTDSFYIPVTE